MIEDRNLLPFRQTFLEFRVLNFESEIFHCGSAALRPPCLVFSWPQSPQRRKSSQHNKVLRTSATTTTRRSRNPTWHGHLGRAHGQSLP